MQTQHRSDFSGVFPQILTTRREAIIGFSSALAVLAAKGVVNANAQNTQIPLETIAGDEQFWATVQQAFDVETSPINLISGANNPSPRAALEMLIDRQRYINPSPLSRTRGRIVNEQKESIRHRLARLAGAGAEEIALTRGTTEGMNVVISGLPLAAGDEFLTTRHDYPSVKSAAYLRARRDGIAVREVDWEPRVENHDEVIEVFEKNITSKTKAVLICHVYDGYGQVMPVRRIAEIAHERGAVVIVDGALAFGNIAVDLGELGCDYYATSLHKWAGAPSGTGFLFVRRDRIPTLTPLYGVPEPNADDIRKFEDVGTAPLAPILAISAALDLFEEIGPERKFARLQYLKNYWSSQLAGRPEIDFLVNRDPAYSGASLSFEIAGAPPRDVWLFLLREKALNVGVHPYRPRNGFRQCNYIAPNVFTQLSQLDTAVQALSGIADTGVPG